MDRHKLQRAISQNKHFTETRKVSLYSNFSRLEETNPDGYEANIAAWKEVLEDAVEHHGFADATCIEAGPELVAALSDVHNGTPLSLHCVLDRMVEEGTLVPLERFEKQYPSVPRSKTSAAVGWVFGRLFPYRAWSSSDSSRESLKKEKYVDIKAVSTGAQLLAKKLQAHAESQGNNLLSKVFNESQVREIAGSEYSKNDVACFLAYGAFEGLLLYDRSLDVVKLPSAGSITDIDSTITALRTQISELVRREVSLEEKIKDLEQRAREALKSGSRKQAKTLLQQKQGVEKSLERTMGTMSQLESILNKIDDANDNQQAYNALQSSSMILTELNKNLSVDDVENLVERLQDSVGDADEITNSLADLNLGKSSAEHEVEEMELDDELEQLEEEESAKKVEKFPKVPQHKPAKEGQREKPQPKKLDSKNNERAAESRREKVPALSN